MDDLFLSPELKSYICSLGCLYNGQRYHDYGTGDQLLAHNTTSKNKRLVHHGGSAEITRDIRNRGFSIYDD